MCFDNCYIYELITKFKYLPLRAFDVICNKFNTNMPDNICYNWNYNLKMKKLYLFENCIYGLCYNIKEQQEVNFCQEPMKYSYFAEFLIKIKMPKKMFPQNKLFQKQN